MSNPALIFNTPDLMELIHTLTEVVERGERCDITMLTLDKGYTFVASPMLNGDCVDDETTSVVYDP
jgi:hypothetical protein